MLIGLLYDLFRIRRKALRTSLVILYLEDLAYWMLVALIMFGIVYYSNDGEFRGFIFLGTLLGVILYILLLSRIVISSALMIIKIISRILYLVWSIFTYPFRIIYRILRIPFRYLSKIARKYFRSTRNVIRNKLSISLNLKRAIRNIIKKK